MGLYFFVDLLPWGSIGGGAVLAGGSNISEFRLNNMNVWNQCKYACSHAVFECVPCLLCNFCMYCMFLCIWYVKWVSLGFIHTHYTHTIWTMVWLLWPYDFFAMGLYWWGALIFRSQTEQKECLKNVYNVRVCMQCLCVCCACCAILACNVMYVCSYRISP